MKTNIQTSVDLFRARQRHITAIAVILLTTLFYLRAEVAFASTVPAPAWLSEEYMAAEAVQAASQEESSVKSSSAAVQTFIISAYYSPLPGQQRYVTGSYEGDIRLNGRGVNGADGTPVYPGMIAAPKTYAFGTKMNIPGIGTVAVHDRGGAIVASGLRGNSYDRLDVWMGYGDTGLTRALKWGKRTVDVMVYGVDPSIQESVALEGYSDGEKFIVHDSFNPSESVTSAPQPAPPRPAAPTLFSNSPSYGEQGEDVKKLQQMLKDLGHYEGEISGTFDGATHDAVMALQLAEKIISHKGAYGSGYIGPRTMTVLANKSVTPPAHASAADVSLTETIARDLQLGDSGDDVRKLQEELKRFNLLGIEPTGYYGETTAHAVFKFQQSQRLVGDKNSNGAGIFGPITRSKFNAIVAARLETEWLISSRSAS